MAEKTQYPEFMDLLRADYARSQCPPLKACYDRVCYLASDRDMDIPSLSTARRLMKANTHLRIVFSGHRVRIDGRSFSTSAPIGATVIVREEPPPSEIVHVYSLDFRTYFGIARPMEEPRPPVTDREIRDKIVDDVMGYAALFATRPERQLDRLADAFSVDKARRCRLGPDSKAKIVVTWRDVPRICLPGWFINRAVEASVRPLYLAGPAIHARLEQRLEQPDDIRGPAWFRGLLRSTALWLTQSPNSGRRATPEEMPDEVFSRPMCGPSTGSGQGSVQSEERA